MMFKKSISSMRSAIQPSQDHIKGLKEDFNTRMAKLMKHRDTSEQKPMEENFSAVLQAWGIEEQEITHVLQMLRVRMGIFLLPLLMSLLMIWQIGISVIIFIAVFLCLAVSVMGIVTTMWRIKILASRRFIPFRHWLWSSFFRMGKKQA